MLCSNNILWEIRSNNTCGSVNVIYYLRFNIWNKKETYIEKTVRTFMLGSNSESTKTYQIVEMMIPRLNIQDMFLVVVEKWLNERTIRMNYFLNLI